MTEAAEFGEIYKLEVVEIPTNVAGASARTRTTRSTAPAREKYDAIVDADRASAARGSQPVLVGTVSIEKSETLADAAQEARRSRTTC